MTRNAIKRKKLLGAALSALAVIGLMLLIALSMLTDRFGGWDRAEMVAVVLCALMAMVTAIGVAVALAQRWKELERGEEDEARKY